jgi:hypothetical protein
MRASCYKVGDFVYVQRGDVLVRRIVTAVLSEKDAPYSSKDGSELGFADRYELEEGVWLLHAPMKVG